jgi:hypothetical protein
MIEFVREVIFYYKNSSINCKNINKIKNNLDDNDKIDVIRNRINKKTINTSSKFKITKQKISFEIDFTEI